MKIYLCYWTPAGRCTRKEFKTMEKARAYGQKLRRKDGYIVTKYGCIHVHKVEDGVTKVTQHDLYE